MAHDEASRVKGQERHCSDMDFQLKREEEKREHVEQQVTHVRMDKTTREHCEVLLLAQEVIRPEQAAVDQAWHPIQAEKAGTDSQGHDG